MSDVQSKTAFEQELVRGCAEKSARHYHMLFDRYYGKMLNVCRRYAKNHEEAQDMVQEGFIRVYKNILQYKGEGSFEGWMRRVMVTTCINYYHKHHRQETVEYIDNLHLAYVADQSNGIEMNDLKKDYDAEYLLKLVQNLPAGYRMVFNLHAIEGYSHFEIAEKLHITESTSRSNLAKARQKLKQMILSPFAQKSIHHE
jgi:RNA polymerase sigma-70 factor (ECF subfamily)